MKKLSSDNLDFLKGFFLNKCGVVLGKDKAYLVEKRLEAITDKHGLSGFDELIKRIRGNNAEIISDCMDGLLTNETYFFRDEKLFRIFEEDIIPILGSNCDGDVINIWSAACSSGQEPYSIAISMLENSHKLKGKNFEIMASDISGKALRKAADGIYSKFEMERGMPDGFMKKYFDELPENKWKIKDEIKKYIRFEGRNLIDKFDHRNKFDAVFCRYVLIYLEEAGKKDIFKRTCEITKSGGTIVLGASETNNLSPEMCSQFEKLRSVFFRK